MYQQADIIHGLIESFLIVQRKMGGAKRVVLLVASITAFSMGAAGLLIATRSAWMFVAALLAISMVAWGMGGLLALPLLRSFFKRILHE